MDVQAAPPTYTPMGGAQPPAGNPPVLGQQVPGMSGGLPAQGGLSVLANPLADELMSMPSQPQQQTNSVNPNTEPNQTAPNAHPYPPAPQYAEGGVVQRAAQQAQQYGRGDDTMLIHMTPHEVGGLQALAMAHGGSLTINPHTGLPEAGWLGKLLPTILGGVLAATGVGAPLAAGLVGVGQTALTGSLKKGLMAGLGAFGGASLAGAAGLGGAISKNAFGALGSKAGIFGANMGLGATAAPTLVEQGGAQIASQIVPEAATTAAANTPVTIAGGLGAEPLVAAADAARPLALGMTNATPQFTGNFFSRFGQAARAGLPTTGIGGMLAKAAPIQAGLGVLGAVSGAMTPGFKNAQGQIDNSYAGPYVAQKREAAFAPATADILGSSKERDYFAVDVPEIRNVMGQVVQPGTTTTPGTMIYQNVLNPRAKKNQPMYSLIGTPYMGVQDEEEAGDMLRAAKGGQVELADGAFVVDARTVSELGNGSSNAGHELLARMGGRPVRGPGDGVSDSVPARIGRDQPARVARDEVIFPPEAVRRVGGGSEKRGAQKLYSLMDKAHKARKKSERGKDTNLRRGLA